MIPRALVLLLLAILNLVTAHSFLRLAHASIDAPKVDVKANGTLLWSGVAFKDITEYKKVAPSTYFIEVLPHLGLHSIYNATITVEKQKYYTVMASGTLYSKPASFAIAMLKDTISPPRDGQSSRLRLYNAISDSEWIQLRVKEDQNTITKKISYRDASEYVDIPSGRWELELWSKGSDVPLFTVVNYFIPGGVYSLFAEGLVKDVSHNTVDLIIQTDRTYKFAAVRASHVSPDAPGVDIYLQDSVSKHKTLLFSDVKYGEFSAYKDYSFMDDTTIVVTGAGSDNVVLTQSVSFQENTHDTILIYGLLSGGTHTPLSMQLVKENLSYPEDYEQAKLKFIHAIPNGPKLKILLNGHTLIHSISYGMVTEYKFVPNEYAKVDVISLVDGSKVISQHVKIAGGNVWTAVLAGIIGGVAHQQPKILLQSDAQFDYFVARAIQASPDLEGKDVSILLKSGRKVVTLFSNLRYHDITHYKVLVLRNWTMSVLVAGKEILVKDLNVNKHDVVTLAIVGMIKSSDNDLQLNAIIIPDNNAAPASSTQNRIRLVHLSPTKIHFDYYLDDKLVSSNNKFSHSTDYFDIGSGDHTIDVKEHKGKAALLKDCFSVEGGSVNTIFIEGILHGTNPQLFAYVSQDVRYQYYQFRLAHTSPDTGKVDVLIEDGHHLIFSGISYGETTPYKELMLANSSLLITESGKKDHVLLRIYPDVVEKQIYTLTLVGMSQRKANRLDYMWLEDDLSAPSSSRDAKVRVIHAAPSSAPVDIYFNNELVFPRMIYKRASDYEFMTAGIYKIDVFISPGHRTPLLSLQTNLTGGEVMTFILEGFNNSVSLLGFKDTAYRYFNLRIAHAAPNVGQIGVLINHNMEFSHIPFTHITQFKEFTSGVKRISVVTHLLHRRVLLRKTLDLNTEKDVTLLITGLDKDIQTPLQMNAILDDFTLPSADDKFKLRFVHAVPGAPNVDIKVGGTLIFEKVSYTSATNYIELHEGVYDVDIFKSGTTNRLLRLDRVKFVGGKVYTIFGEGTVGNMIGKISSDYYPPPVASLRVIQASPNLGHVDLTLNGSPMFPNLDFKEHSSYQTLDPGSYRVVVLPHNQVKPVYLEDSIFVERFKDYSYLITGEWNATNLNHKIDSILVEDDNQLPGDEDIKIRFIHACVACPALEVRANGVVLFDHVAYKDISDYQIMESSTYRLHIFEKHGGSKLQSFDLDLRTHKDKSAVYTLVATGHDINSLQIISLRDAGSKPPKPHRRKKRSNSGLIAMIVIFSIAATLLVVVGVWLLMRRRRQRGYTSLT